MVGCATHIHDFSYLVEAGFVGPRLRTGSSLAVSLIRQGESIEALVSTDWGL